MSEQKPVTPETTSVPKKPATSDSPYIFTVGEVYEGPLDLLLDLVRKQNIDIYDIPIAKITQQFLGYVDRLQAQDVDSAGEFIYVASLLIHIKSKMLLPRLPGEVAQEEDDPRRELVERLLEHEKFKSAAQMLLQKQQIEEASWSRPSLAQFSGEPGTEQDIAADTVDLVRVFRDILERARQRPVLDVEEENVTVGQMIGFLRRRLVMEDKPVGLRRLLQGAHSERALICMFLALLELTRLQAVLLHQEHGGADILIKKNVEFDNVLGEDGLHVRDDWR